MHESLVGTFEMPTVLINVRYQGQLGRHLLTRSSSQFDPTETSWSGSLVALLAGRLVWRRCFFPSPNEVVALPRGVDQYETERLGRAQITNLMLVTGVRSLPVLMYSIDAGMRSNMTWI